MPIVVIIDDDNISRLITVHHLKSIDESLEFIEFDSAVKAYDYFQMSGSKMPDLILLDINMPIMSGWQFLEAVSNKNSLLEGVNVVMLSSSISLMDTSRITEFNMVSEYLIKPMDAYMATNLLFTILG